MDTNKNQPLQSNNRRRKKGITLSKPVFWLFLMLSFWGIWSLWTNGISPKNKAITTSNIGELPSPTATQLPITESTDENEIAAQVATLLPEINVITATPAPHVPSNLLGLMVASISEQGYFHLFAYHPDHLPLTRLTYGEWDDLSPSLSPDGSKILFSSNRDSYWNIYFLEISSGEITQITNDDNFNGAPTWSPDGGWIAYEKFVDGNLDIYLQPLDGNLDPIRATFDTRSDQSPTWSADNSKIAFSSNRNGNFDIWVLNIESIGIDGSLKNITNNNTVAHTNPTWSPIENKLAYVMPNQGYPSVYVTDLSIETQNMEYVGFGNQPTWDADGNYILAALPTPDQTLLAAYSVGSKTYVLPPLSLEGRISGLSWGIGNHPFSFGDSLLKTSLITPEPSYEIALTPSVGSLYGRQYTIDLPDVKAPYPALSALAIEPFLSFRQRINTELGWDILSDLENLFIPVNQPLSPYRENDWLYTGRAFSLNPILVDMGWMIIVKEDFGIQSFWRVYIKPLNQDGSQGKPITQLAWDFDLRFTGNTTDYENGGAQDITLPTGYWVDFTAIAFEYGWERLPALSNWRSYYPGIRFNTFALTSGLDWEDAMLQIWPPEVLNNIP